MATWYVAPGAPVANTGTSWLTDPGDLATIVGNLILTPSPGGDEIWAAGDNNVLGAAYQGNYNLAGNPLSIVGNTQPLSIYGSFEGKETSLCERNAKINSTQYLTNFFQNPSILDGGGANSVKIGRAHV